MSAKINRQIRNYQIQQIQMVHQQTHAHRMQEERKDAVRVNETRVAKNIRLDCDKGRYVDVDV